MAWWDSGHRTAGAMPSSKPRPSLGDGVPKLEPGHKKDRHTTMERERARALLSPVSEEHLWPPATPALVVHVEMRFTDPVIRSTYFRSYGSSPAFDATNRVCRGLVRRIERCSEEFITRKDSAALDVYKGDDGYERKPQRFEMSFRVVRRGNGEWAERTYRSYQKHPLTVAFTREAALAAHRMIGLFLRRHDDNFQWLDCPVPDPDLLGTETAVPSHGGPLSLLSVPRSPFIEATQTFETLPGYRIELCFRSRNPQRRVLAYERRITVNSTQTSPLTLFMSEDMLWKALQAINQGLDAKKREYDDLVRGRSTLDNGQHFGDDTLEVDLRISNNLGPLFDHVHRNIKSQLALFRDRDASDCDSFLCDIQTFLSNARREADAALNDTNDLEIRIIELKAAGWSLRDAAQFTLDSSTSYGRRTIQAALDRIQTGIGDVIRGHNVAVHITAHKRGHLVLDKAIVAHEKRGRPLREIFTSREDAQTTFVARLKSRIQMDMDKVFEDSCCIDDIPEDDDDYLSSRPVTPAQQQTEKTPAEAPSPVSSMKSSPASQPSMVPTGNKSSPRSRAQRVFSLSRRSSESVRSIDYLKAAARDLFSSRSRRPGSAASDQGSETNGAAVVSPGSDGRGLLAPADVKPTRLFSLMSRRRSSGTTRVSNASTLVDENSVRSAGSSVASQNGRKGEAQVVIGETGVNGMAKSEKGARPATGAGLAEGVPPTATPDTNTSPTPTPRQFSTPSRSKPRPLDGPDTFEDAREFTLAPCAEAEAPLPSDPSGSTPSGPELPRVADQDDDDGFSTAPSTPALSTGSSSPRYSVPLTPVFLRTNHGVGALRQPHDDFAPEHCAPPGFLGKGEEGESATGLPGEEDGEHAGYGSGGGGGGGLVVAVTGESEDHATPSLHPPPPRAVPRATATTAAATRAEGQGEAAGGGGANTMLPAAEPCDATVRDVPPAVLTPRPAATTATTTTPAATPSLAATNVDTNTPTPHICHDNDALTLGPEPQPAPSDTLFPAPDFPTPHLRRSGPNHHNQSSFTDDRAARLQNGTDAAGAPDAGNIVLGSPLDESGAGGAEAGVDSAGVVTEESVLGTDGEVGEEMGPRNGFGVGLGGVVGGEKGQDGPGLLFGKGGNLPLAETLGESLDEHVESASGPVVPSTVLEHPAVAGPDKEPAAPTFAGLGIGGDVAPEAWFLAPEPDAGHQFLSLVEVVNSGGAVQDAPPRPATAPTVAENAALGKSALPEALVDNAVGAESTELGGSGEPVVAEGAETETSVRGACEGLAEGSISALTVTGLETSPRGLLGTVAGEQAGGSANVVNGVEAGLSSEPLKKDVSHELEAAVDAVQEIPAEAFESLAGGVLLVQSGGDSTEPNHAATHSGTKPLEPQPVDEHLSTHTNDAGETGVDKPDQQATPRLDIPIPPALLGPDDAPGAPAESEIHPPQVCPEPGLESSVDKHIPSSDLPDDLTTTTTTFTTTTLDLEPRLSLTTTRNSVDTIRLSTDLSLPYTASPDDLDDSPPHPAAGWLGIGLRESRIVEVGLRGALGGVKTTLGRGRGLGLGVGLGLRAAVDVDSAAAVDGEEVLPQAAVGSAWRAKAVKREASDRGGEEVVEGDAGDAAGQSVLPRMMMLLAGAVAVGKMLDRGAV